MYLYTVPLSASSTVAFRAVGRCRPCRSSMAVLLTRRHYTAIPLSRAFRMRSMRPDVQRSAAEASSAAQTSRTSSSDAAGAAFSDGCAQAQKPFVRAHCSPASLSSLMRRSASTAATAAAAEELRVREAPRPASCPVCVRVPRLLVFGGDVVSVTALEALHARMRCIVREALRSSRGRASSSAAATCEEAAEEAAEVDAFVRDHITVVCPALPKSVTPEEAAKRFTRQYPVARYCVDHGLPIIPVDDPKSLSKSTLLKEMLRSTQNDASSASSVSHSASAASSPSPLHWKTNGARNKSVLPLLCRRTAASEAPAVRRSGASVQRSEAAEHNSATGGKQTDKGKASNRGKSEAAAAPAHTWAAEGRPLSDYDLVVVVSFRYFLPQRLLRVLPPVINMHPSLLPRYRGASPIFSALRHNEAVGGVSIIQMKPEQTAMDSGSILWQCEVPMTPDMDIRLYFPLVTQIGAAGLCDLVFGEAPAAAASRTLMLSSSTAHSASANGHAAAGVAPSHSWLQAHASAPCATLEGHNLNGNEAENVEPAVLSSHRRSGQDANGGHPRNGSASVPPWVALRRSSLMPDVHRCRHSAHASVSSPLHGRERLSPFMDRPELAVLSSIITAHTGNGVGASSSMITEQTNESSGDKAERTPCDADDPRRRHPWMTLCRATSHLTPEAVRAASTAHRALFFQNLENASAAAAAMPVTVSGSKQKGKPVNKKQVSSAAAAELAISTTMKCAEVFPKSVLSSHCDWPDSFSYSWKFAQLQEYHTFAHFTEDPFHAPLLPKDAAVLRFSSYDAHEAFGVWRAFVGGDYFQPSMNATLDKGSTPVHNQLVHRTVRRLLRERAKAIQKKRASKGKSSGVPHVQARAACDTRVAQSEKEAALSHAAMAATSEDNDMPIGMVVGKHVELDVFNPEGLRLLTEAEHTLRTPCTFTRVTNPSLVPQCVQDELAEVEKGGHWCGGRSSSSSSRRLRFYRAPPAIFRSLLSTKRVEEKQKRSHEGLDLEKARCGCGDAPASQSTTADRSAATSSSVANTANSSALKRCEEVEPAEDEEAPEDYVPDIIHAAPPTEQRCHIPPGSGYFPVSDESYGAIKCKDGWFLWQEAHMKWANKAQPAVLIRKGLAMKPGIVYVGLFSEYS